MTQGTHPWSAETNGILMLQLGVRNEHVWGTVRRQNNGREWMYRLELADTEIFIIHFTDNLGIASIFSLDLLKEKRGGARSSLKSE